LIDALGTRITRKWPAKSIGERIDELSSEFGVQIVFDSRVDRTTTCSGGPKDLPVELLIDLAASMGGGKFVLIDDVGFVAYEPSASRLAAAIVAGESPRRRTQGEHRGKLFGDERVDFEVRDQEFVSQALERLLGRDRFDVTFDETGVPGANVALKAQRFQEVRLETAVTLLLAQADATLGYHAELKRLAPIELPDNETSSIEAVVPAKHKETRLADLEKRFKGLSLKRSGSTLTATGPAATVAAFPRRLVWELEAPTRPKVAGGAKTYTVTQRNVTLKQFAASMSRATGKKVTIDAESLDAVGKSDLDRVNCIATELTAEELLDVALDPLGLSYRKSGGGFVIFAERKN
jgi:hypothetical protein